MKSYLSLNGGELFSISFFYFLNFKKKFLNKQYYVHMRKKEKLLAEIHLKLQYFTIIKNKDALETNKIYFVFHFLGQMQ